MPLGRSDSERIVYVEPHGGYRWDASLVREVAEVIARIDRRAQLIMRQKAVERGGYD